jgi:prepilin-type N-terminal cleavage/methylation domain-containing protein
MKDSPFRGEQGFTLVESLIVIALLGLIMGAVYSLFRVQRNTAYSQVEVVEEQQNLRVALDNISRDLRLAGIMMPIVTNPIPAATGSPAFPTYASDIRINVASAEGRFARVTAQYNIGPTASTLALTVESPATATSPNVIDGFAVNDNVRIIRPPIDGSQPISSGSVFVITNTNRTANTITIRKQDSLYFTDGETVAPGDMITKVTDATMFPETVDYYLVNGGTTVNGIVCPNNQRCLVRQVNSAATPPGSAEIIATKLSALTFGYLNDSYAEETVPSDLSRVRAVRVTLQGTTTATAALSGGGRVRALTSVIKLRNRR